MLATPKIHNRLWYKIHGRGIWENLEDAIAPGISTLGMLWLSRFVKRIIHEIFDGDVSGVFVTKILPIKSLCCAMSFFIRHTYRIYRNKGMFNIVLQSKKYINSPTWKTPINKFALTNHAGQMVSFLNIYGLFHPRLVLVFGYCRCLRVCVCMCLSVNHQLVRTITHQPFKLEQPNLDQRCVRPCVRSLLFLLLLLLGGGGGRLTLYYKFKLNLRVKIYPILSLSVR